MKKLFIGTFLALALTGLLAAQSDLKKPAASVYLPKSKPITISVEELRKQVEQYEKQNGVTLSVDDRKQILNVMINDKLVLQAAEVAGITVTDNEVNQMIQQSRESMRQSLGRLPTDAEFATIVKNQTGLDLPAYRDSLKNNLIFQRYVTTKKKDTISSLKVPTEEEIKKEYELYKSKLVRPETVRITMLQVPFTDTASRAKAKEAIDKLVREIGTNPAKFDEAFSKFNEAFSRYNETLIKEQGSNIGYPEAVSKFTDAVVKGQISNVSYLAGDGGYIPRNPETQQRVGAEFMDAVFSLNPGEVSRAIEGARGYQIIKVTEKYAQENLTLDGIFDLETRTTVRDYLGSDILQEREQVLMQTISQELVTELRQGNPFQIIDANLNW